MKNMHRVRCLILIVALMMILGACAPAAQPQESSEDELINGKLMLVDPESSQSAPYQPEYPSADDETALTGEQSALPESDSGDSGLVSAAPAPSTQAESGAASQAETSYAPEPESAVPAPSSSAPENPAPSKSSAASMISDSAIRSAPVAEEARSVWISYLEMDNLLRGKTKSQFTSNIGKVFDNCRSYGLNTVIVHVRPFADALYNSEYFPWSYICTGTEGVGPGYDPLEVMVEEAHARGLRIEAWLNPYRIRAAESKITLCDSNQASRWLSAGDSAVIRYNGVTSYNPASPKARELIVNGAREIVREYGVDGIHIDDYFYPTTDAAFDSASYNTYKNGGGTLALADWRRQNVETLIKALYAGIKAENPSAVFGVSPQSSVYNNYNAMYLDVAKISGNAGYCDYICPQIYFGYKNGTQPYLETLEAWNKMVNTDVVKLYVGIAAYKSGATDSWAGAGKDEWLQNTDLLKRMVQSARAQDTYGGFVLYRYDSLFNPAQAVSAHVQKEYGNLKSIL